MVCECIFPWSRGTAYGGAIFSAVSLVTFPIFSPWLAFLYVFALSFGVCLSISLLSLSLCSFKSCPIVGWGG